MRILRAKSVKFDSKPAEGDIPEGCYVVKEAMMGDGWTTTCEMSAIEEFNK